MSNKYTVSHESPVHMDASFNGVSVYPLNRKVGISVGASNTKNDGIIALVRKEGRDADNVMYGNMSISYDIADAFKMRVADGDDSVLKDLADLYKQLMDDGKMRDYDGNPADEKWVEPCREHFMIMYEIVNANSL